MPDWIIPVAIAIALGLALLFAPTRRLLRKALNLIPALALLVIGLAAYVLWRPVNWLIARVPFLANASGASFDVPKPAVDASVAK